jgi:hypothetical protein
VTEKKLLILLREVVAARANFRCEFPGCTKTECDPHHVGGRGNAVKYDPDTCINLCAGPDGHHVTGMVSAHGTPHFFKAIIIEKNIRTVEWFEEVNRKKNVIVKDTKEFRAACGEKLQAELRRIAA